MKYAVLTTCLVFSLTRIYPQKPPIDSSTYGKWPFTSGGRITNDGKYIAYRVSTDPFGMWGDGYFILKSVQGNWTFTVSALPLSLSFSDDSRFAYFMGSGDTLCKVALGGKIIERIPEAIGYRLINVGNSQWLIYRKKTASGELIMQNMSTGIVKKYSDITDYQFSDDGKVLILQSESKVDSTSKYELRWEDFPDGYSVSVLKGNKAGDIQMDRLHHQLLFSTQKMVGEKSIKSYWCFKEGSDSARELINDEEVKLTQPGFELGGIMRLSKEGDRLFFMLAEKTIDLPKPLADAVPVEVWNYRDEKLQSRQQEELKGGGNLRKSYLAVLNIADHRIIRLQGENEEFVQLPPVGKMSDDFAIIKHLTIRDGSEVAWNPNEGEVYIVSTKDGSRRPMTTLKGDWGREIDISPEGRYIVFYKADSRNFFSYAVHSGVTRNITHAITITQIRYNDRPEGYHLPNFKIVGWLDGDSAMLVWDEYDIWKVDLAGNQMPVNLTNGYGRKHRISLELVRGDQGTIVHSTAKLLLYAFNQDNKENGFYWLTLGKNGDPELLTMGPYIYYYPHIWQNIGDEAPVKARDADVWLVKRMSARESANYYWTSDLKRFVPESDVHPEKDWNWVTTKLINWKTPDGSSSQGVLYKPENFDPGKKYPIIFYYYERLSERLNVCLAPDLSQGDLNILWYVSNGYLVFTPDIYYKIGEAGESALNYVESAAHHLARMPWVDSSRMGLQGHSFGGVQTNYIITHSHLFAAACSASGFSDFISAYGGIDGWGSSLEYGFEGGQLRMGVTLWQRPDLYIKNSAIFKADKVTTPLLLMHTTDDKVCPVANIKEFFIALRRLRKPVWMLLYGNADHTLEGKSSLDFTIRMQQFFDHYLKGALAPKWMVDGIPAKLKGIEMGLELEDTKSK